jgi:hypothetical protein
MGDRLKLQFLLFEAYHLPGKIFTNKTIKEALLQMKKCLLDAEICWPLFVRRKSAFSCFLHQDRSARPLSGRTSAINSEFAPPVGRKKTAKRPLFVRNFFDPFEVVLWRSVFPRQ